MILRRIIYSARTPTISKVFRADAQLCVVIWDIGLYWGICMAWDPKSQKLRFNWEKHCQIRHGHSWLPSIVAPDDGRTTPRLQGEGLGPTSKELSSQRKTFIDSYRLCPKTEQNNSSAGRKTRSCMPWGLLLFKQGFNKLQNSTPRIIVSLCNSKSSWEAVLDEPLTKRLTDNQDRFHEKLIKPLTGIGKVPPRQHLGPGTPQPEYGNWTNNPLSMGKMISPPYIGNSVSPLTCSTVLSANSCVLRTALVSHRNF